MLEALETQVKEDDCNATAEIEALRKMLTPNLDEHLDRHRTEVSNVLKDMITAAYLGLHKTIPYKLTHDKVLQRGCELLKQQ